jgi:hypothetical protein
MFLWPIVEGCLTVVIAWFVISQMIIPAIRNTPAFPLFRKTVQLKGGVQEQIRELHEIKEAKDLIQEADLLKRDLTKKHKH